MSSYYQKGRADAAKGIYDPPKDGFFDSKEDREKTKHKLQEYREGYYDKKREMGND